MSCSTFTCIQKRVKLTRQIIAGKCRDLIYKDDSSDAVTSVSGASGGHATFDPLELSALPSCLSPRSYMLLAVRVQANT